MSTTRAPQSRPGIATPEAKLERIRTYLARGESGKLTARDVGVSEGTVRKYREMWLRDGSLVLPERAVAVLEYGRALARGGASRADSGESPTAEPGEVGRSDETGAQRVDPAQPPPEPGPGDVAQSPVVVMSPPPPEPPNPYGRALDLPPDDEGFGFGVSDAGELVVNVRFQVAITHIAAYQQMIRLGLIPPEMSLNAWVMGMVDDHLATCVGLSLVLARVELQQQQEAPAA